MVSMDLELQNKVAVVTGASQGIGLATALTLRAEGARVVAVSRRTSAKLAAALDDALVHVSADLSTPEGPARAVAAAVERFGRLDVLVNNAGGPPPGVTMPRFSFDDLDDEDWAAMLDFNLLSIVRAVRAALPHLLERGGSIVNVSSTHAHVPSARERGLRRGQGRSEQPDPGAVGGVRPAGRRVNTVSRAGAHGVVDQGGWCCDVLAQATGSDRDTVMDKSAAAMMNLTTGRLIDPRRTDVIVLLASPRLGEHHRLRRHRGRRAAQGGVTASAEELLEEPLLRSQPCCSRKPKSGSLILSVSKE